MDPLGLWLVLGICSCWKFTARAVFQCLDKNGWGFPCAFRWKIIIESGFGADGFNFLGVDVKKLNTVGGPPEIISPIENPILSCWGSLVASRRCIINTLPEMKQYSITATIKSEALKTSWSSWLLDSFVPLPRAGVGVYVFRWIGDLFASGHCWLSNGLRLKAVHFALSSWQGVEEGCLHWWVCILIEFNEQCTNFNQTVICLDAILPHIVMVPWKTGVSPISE